MHAVRCHTNFDQKSSWAKKNQDCNIQIKLDKMHSQRLGKKSAEELLSKYQLTQMNTNIRHCEKCGSKLLKKITQI